MAINLAAVGAADVEAYIAQATLPLARRQLVVYQFGDPLTLPKGRGVVYQAARWNRVPLPYTSLSEGVPPVGQNMTVTMVSATAVQWGDKITLTDIAEMTIKHPMFQIAKQLCALAVAETLERNTFNAIMGGTQINYVNSRASRALLVGGDTLNLHEFNRAQAVLATYGAPRYMGDEMTNTKLDAEAGGAKASNDPRGMPHYTAVLHTVCAQDVRENATFVLASSYSDINKLYNAEIGELNGIRFTATNLVPSFTGFLSSSNGATYTPGASGSLATASYYIIVTGSDTQNQYESQIYAASGAQSVTGPNGSIAVKTPSTTGFTYNVYIGTTNTPTNLGLSASGPSVGPLVGQAVQLPPATTVTITGLGVAQTPPAPPGNGYTVYPCFIFGRGAYGQVSLDEIKYTYLDKADKSDPLNQLRVVGWKVMYGTIILNNGFFMRIESTSNFSPTADAGP